MWRLYLHWQGAVMCLPLLGQSTVSIYLGDCFRGEACKHTPPAPNSPEKSLIYGLLSAPICPCSGGVFYRWRSSAAYVPVWRRLRNILPGWNGGQMPPHIQRTASRWRYGKSPLPAPCPAARPPSGTTCSRFSE